MQWLNVAINQKKLSRDKAAWFLFWQFPRHILSASFYSFKILRHITRSQLLLWYKSFSESSYFRKTLSQYLESQFGIPALDRCWTLWMTLSSYSLISFIKHLLVINSHSGFSSKLMAFKFQLDICVCLKISRYEDFKTSSVD